MANFSQRQPFFIKLDDIPSGKSPIRAKTHRCRDWGCEMTPIS
jgi:hypothetical protein